jgi:RHS repeat-associated protein
MPQPIHAGAVKGEFRIDSDGSAAYSIPIQCPPGPRSITPSVSVGYNSAGGNDLLGVGWGLQGFSTITRCAATVAQDGFTGTVNLDRGDRFALDGQRLIAVEGRDGFPDAVYRTEIDSWKKIVPVYGNNPDKGPTSFRVYDRQGTIYEFGFTADSRLLTPAGDAVRSWSISRLTNLAGSYQRFIYEPDVANGVSYPLRLEYGGFANDPPRRSIRIRYEARDDGAAKYTAGLGSRITRRVSNIDSFLDESPVMQYRFTYETGKLTSRSRLISVTQAGSKGGELPATRFEWQEGNTNLFGSSTTLAASGAPEGGTLLPMDINGDGVVDLVHARDEDGTLQLDLYLARHGGSGFDSRWTMPATGLAGNGQLFPMDVDGDGCIDLVHASDNDGQLELTVLKATQSGARWILKPGARGAGGPAGLAGSGLLFSLDVDGDGLPDLVHITDHDGTSTITTLFSDGTRFARDPKDHTLPCQTGFGEWIPGDYNGDGMADLVHASERDGALHLDLFTSRGRAGFVRQSASPQAQPVGMGVMIPIDVNGDGKTDLVNAFYNDTRLELTSLVSTGKGFASQPTQRPALPGAANHATLMPADLNGDGLMDLLLAWSSEDGTTSVGGLMSNGSGLAFCNPASQPLKTAGWARFLPLDLDGDGRTDLLHAAQDNGKLVLRQVLIAGDYPDLLKSITNGIGGRHEIRYDTMTNPAIYSKQTIAPNAPAVKGIETAPLLNSGVSGSTYALVGGSGSTPGAVYATKITAFPKQLVCSYLHTTGSGAPSEYKYFYRAGRLDVTGRGWLGFESSAMTDVEFDTATLTEFHRNFPLERSPSRITTSRASDGTLIQKVQYTQEAAPTSPKTWSVRERLVDVEFLSLGAPGSAPDAVRRRTSDYDAWGNLVRMSDSGTGQGAPTCYSFETFSPPDTARWVLGRSVEAAVTADAKGEQVLRRERHTYDQATGRVLTQQAWNDQTQSWLASTYTYDNFGNATSSTDPSGATTNVTFDSEYHAFPVRVESPPNAQGKRIVSKFEFNPHNGEQKTRFQPKTSDDSSTDGPVVAKVFDELGRTIEEHGPDPSGKLVPLVKRSWVAGKDGVYQEEQTRVDWAGTAWHWKRSWLDGEGRIYRTAALGPDGARTVTMRRILDGRGNILEETLPCYEGDPVTTVKRKYDAAGRLIAEVRAESTTRYEYPTAFKTVAIEAYGKPEARTTTTHYVQCGDERLPVRRVAGNGETTTFTYDGLARLTSAVDPLGVVSSARYDSLGRQVYSSVIGAKGMQLERTFLRDDQQRRTTSTQPDGKSVTVSSDALQRTLKKVYSDGATVEFLYDQSADSLGRLSEVRDTHGAGTRYKYDRVGNQTRVETSVEGKSYPFDRSFAPAGHVLTLTYPDGSVETSAYNASHQQLAIAIGDVSASFGDFTATGTPKQIVLGNGIRETRSYRNNGQLASQSLARADGGQLARHDFEWNAMGQLSAILDRVDGANDRKFSYDISGRLGSAIEGSVRTSFEYDGGGNLTAKGNVKYNYDGYRVRTGASGEQNVFSADYDADGNMKSVVRNGQKRSFEYDGAGCLASTEGVRFTYDYTGRRLTKKVENGPLTIYVAPQYEVVRFPKGQVQSTRYITSAHGLVAAITKVDANPSGVQETAEGVSAPGIFYSHSDYNGSVALQTNLNGLVVARVRYDSYGKPSVIGPDNIRHKFTGKEFDRETGLYYFESRYYDPETGRFTTADDRLGGPETCRDVLNRYAYVINDPLNNTDLTGHMFDLGYGFEWGRFFSEIKDAFETPLGKKITMAILGSALIIAGAALTFFAGPAGVGLALLGGTLLGAGISATAYLASNSNSLEWRDFGIQLGIGAATGLVTAGISSGAGLIIARGVATQALTWGATGASRIAVAIIAATVSGTAASVGTKYLNNLAKGKSGDDVHDGVASSAAYGAIFGLVGGAVGSGTGALASKTSGRDYYSHLPDGWTSVESSGYSFAADKAPKFFMGLKDLLISPLVNALPEM